MPISSWTRNRSAGETLQFCHAVSSLLSKSGLPISSKLNQLVQERRYRDVIEFQFDYTAFDSVEDVIAARQIQALFSKQKPWIGLGYDADSAGLRAFREAEIKCAETNIRLGSTRPPGRVGNILHIAQHKISEILGRVPRLSDLKIQFGPGATTSTLSSRASPRGKCSDSLACSESLLPTVGHLLAEMPLLAQHHSSDGWSSDLSSLRKEGDKITSDATCSVDVRVDFGKLVFVPKSVKTTRPIVVEPVLNGLGQKGIGSYIRDRMLHVTHQDLRDQNRNKEGARIGSITGGYATVDLSSASDTIAIGLVVELLPPDWVDFLSEFRTPSVHLKDEIFHLEKWSSMGNAYTFELESLIFYSLAYAVCARLNCERVGYWNNAYYPIGLQVYGDDIVIPVSAHALLVEVLEWCGFSVNQSKSFCSGPFRESCGADWFEGIDVRPFYLRDKISDRTLYTFHNWAIKACERELASLILSYTHPALRLFGPDGYGDGHLIGSYQLRSNRKLRRDGWEGGFFDTYSLKPRHLKGSRDGDWVYTSYSVYTRSGKRNSTDPDIVRGSYGYAKTSIYTLAPSIFWKDSDLFGLKV